jgi:phosphatidylglycerophosphate synthase
MTDITPPPPQTLTDHLRLRTQIYSDAAGQWLHRMGVHPDWVSWTGFIGIGIGAWVLAGGRLHLAGWIFFFAALMDALDGAVARARKKNNPLGAVLDSLFDRYADGFIFASLGYYFASQNQYDLLIVALLALVGSFNVSYLRARGNNPDVQVSVKVGWFTRLERLAIIVWGLWLHPWLLIPAVWMLAIGTNLTVLQRLWYIRQHTED